MAKAQRKPKAEPAGPIKLDLGCGKNPRDGFIGVDCRPFDGVTHLCDLRAAPWVLKEVVESDMKYSADAVQVGGGKWRYGAKGASPIADNSIEEVHCSHFVEHLTGPERIHFVNELYRVLIPGGKATIITPHWASCRAYGDLTHQWPPVSEFWWYYLSKAWRDSQAPHNDGYTCDFDAVWGYGMQPEISGKNQEYQQYAMAHYKEAITDMQATLTAKK